MGSLGRRRLRRGIVARRRRGNRGCSPFAWTVAGLLGSVASVLSPTVPRLGAQEVRFVPRPESGAQRALARFLDREAFTVWTRDTLLARQDVVVGNLLILEASVRIEGTVEGSVYVVDGDLFLRPGSRILGEVVALGGGLYRSGLAVVEGHVTYRPNEVLQVLPEKGGYRIYAVEERPKAVELGGFYGLRFPGYQRVDGWTFQWRGTLRAVGLGGQPEVEAAVRFKTDRGEPEGSIRHFWHPAAGVRVGAEGGRETVSNETWIRGDFPNTFSFLLFGNDYRNYYRSDHAAAVVEISARSGWVWTVSGGWERARSLEATERTVLFASDSVRPNPPIDPGDVYFVEGIVAFEARGVSSRTSLHLHLEGASRAVAGDFSFLMGEAQLFLRRPLAGGHALELLALARGDLAGSLPRQRWSAMGGIGTLPTFPILGLRGERMFLGELTYLIPIPVLNVPRIGPTELLLRGAVGSAWSPGESLEAEANLMAGLRVLLMEAAVAVDPGSSDLDPQLFLVGRWPRILRGH